MLATATATATATKRTLVASRTLQGLATLSSRLSVPCLQLELKRVRAQLVRVIDHQPDWIFERRQVAQQPLHQSPAVQVRRPGHRPHQTGPGPVWRGAPASAIHDRSRTVLPLPAGADTTVTRAGPRAARTAPGGPPPRPGYHGQRRPPSATQPEIPHP